MGDVKTNDLDHARAMAQLQEERKKFREVVEPIMCQQMADTIEPDDATTD